MTTKAQTTHTLIASQVLAAGGAALRGVLDCRAHDAGLVTGQILNGATGPSVQCVLRVYVAHHAGTVPPAGPEGPAATDWKLVHEVGGGTLANTRTRLPLFRWGPEVAFLQVECHGNTVQPVTVEAHATLTDYV